MNPTPQTHPPAEINPILIVDDQWIVRDMVGDILSDAGFPVATAEDGVEAWELFQSREGKFALIISDINMPRMGGLELIEKIRAIDPHIPLIVLTSSNEMSVAIEAINHGASDYLLKDENMGDLVLLSVQKMQKMFRMGVENRELLKKLSTRNSDLEKALHQVQTTHEALKASQDQLIQAEKMASLGRLVAGVAHEVNTPIGIGLTAATLLAAKTREISQALQGRTMKKSDLEKYLLKTAENAHLLQSNLTRTAELVQSFKMVAADRSSRERRVFVVKSYLEELLFSLRPHLEKTPHQIKISCPESLTLDNYPGVFAQIVTNLIMNALIHAFDEGMAGQIEIEIYSREEQLVLSFRDNGKGIPPKQLGRIFDPFFTTRRNAGGTGLGLHVVYNLVQQTLGGQITCESEPGKGSTFEITLPRQSL
ncbi:MAG: response regulator [Magnetococcales bacterium]|nr:response regulator [Magnetococcales bacterium]